MAPNSNLKDNSFNMRNSRKKSRLIYDRYHRPIINLRVAVTQQCNLRCHYCHREGEPSKSETEMTPQEIGRIVKVLAGLGVSKVKITGGEPLLRKDITQIVRQIAHTPGITEVSMTTNATLLMEKADDLRKSGLKRVNITLPALSPRVYHEITGGNIKSAIKGIKAAIHAGLHPVKINMVLVRGVNSGEVDRMIEFCQKVGAALQLIELEPVNVPPEYYNKYFFPLTEIENKLKERAQKVEVRRYMQNRKIYHLPKVNVELVHPIENSEFCFHCTRIRLTSDGKLKPCLMRADNLVDVLTPMRKGATDTDLAHLFLEAVNRREPYYKPKVIAA